MDLDRWMTYRDFVLERHRVWQRRQDGDPGPWSRDRVLASRKFTNVFRILDPGTQFVLTDLAGVDPRDELYRLFLYRHTGRVEAWQYLPIALGAYPGADDSDEVFKAWAEYRGPGVRKENNRKPEADRYKENQHRPAGQGYTEYKRSVFTGAYLVFPQSQVPGTDKLRSIVDLAHRVFDRDAALDYWWEQASAPAERFRLLRSQKGVGDFMSMQVLADWNYLHALDDENSFVIAGPGARKGASLVFPGVKPETAIQDARELWLGDPECPTLAGRPPSLMDVQNTMCEFSKYARYLTRAPGKPYKPAHPGPQEPPVLPKRWN